MGKKKIGTQTEQEALQAADKVEAAAAKQADKSVAHRVSSGRVYVKASYNNTLITVTDDKGNELFWSSAGSIGFNGPKKATPFAASKVVAVLAEKLKKAGMTSISIFINGIGGGRDSTVRSFANQGFNITSIKDVTPVPHNGPKPPKVRRV